METIERRCIPTRCTRCLPLSAICLAAIVSADLRGELVAYYNFDDGRTVTDLSGNNHDGTVIHNAGFSADTPDGSAFSLDLRADGVGPGQDYVRIGPEVDGFGDPAGRDLGIAETNSFTISAWVNYSFSERGIVTVKQDLTSAGSDRSGITFGIDTEDRLFFGIIASTEDDFDDESNTAPTFRDITTDDVVPTGEWVHIAGTYDFDDDAVVGYINGSASEFYLVNPAGSIEDDGTNVTGGAGIDWFDNDGAFTGLGASGNGPLHGDSAGDFTRLFYDGLLDDVAIWNEALPADVIQSLASGEVKPLQLGAALPGDFNADGEVNDADIDRMSDAMLANDTSFDLDGDGDADFDDRVVLVKDLIGTWIGDSNLDGEFSSTDFVVVLTAGKFETGQLATWAEGDWNGDTNFDSSDFVAALRDGGFEQGPLQVVNVPEPGSATLLFSGLLATIVATRKCHHPALYHGPPRL